MGRICEGSLGSSGYRAWEVLLISTSDAKHFTNQHLLHLADCPGVCVFVERGRKLEAGLGCHFVDVFEKVVDHGPKCLNN